MRSLCWDSRTWERTAEAFYVGISSCVHIHHSFPGPATYLCYVIESEGALALNVVVSPIIERVVLADQSLKGRSDTSPL